MLPPIQSDNFMITPKVLLVSWFTYILPGLNIGFTLFLWLVKDVSRSLKKKKEREKKRNTIFKTAVHFPNRICSYCNWIEEKVCIIKKQCWCTMKFWMKNLTPWPASVSSCEMIVTIDGLMGISSPNHLWSSIVDAWMLWVVARLGERSLSRLSCDTHWFGMTVTYGYLRTRVGVLKERDTVKIGGAVNEWDGKMQTTHIDVGRKY